MKRTPLRLGAGMAALLIFVLLISSRTVPAGSIAVLQNHVGRSNPILLTEGRHWRIPLWESIHIYPRAPIDMEGEISLRSREEAEIRMPYRLELLLDQETIVAAHREGKEREARSWARRKVEEALIRVGARAFTYQLLRDVLPPSLERPLLAELKEVGLVTGSLKLGPGTASPEVLAQFEPARLAEMRRDTGTRVVIVGLDGADWKFALPMIEKGELPNLARIRREGAAGKLRTNQPALSPLLWTTVATGKSPDIHGINDFLVLDPVSGRLEPISSRFRKVKALWNIATDAGLTSEFIAWWATWPAEPVRGIMVSDRVSYSLFTFLSGEKVSGGETYPEGYFQEIGPHLRSEADITYREISRFVKVSRDEFEAARTPAARRGLRGEDLESVSTLIRVLASTDNYHRIALDLLGRKQPDLFAVYYQGIDEVNHRFAHLAPPRMPGVDGATYGKFSGALGEFYRYQDRLLGEILEKLGPDTILILLSDHGFSSGEERPQDFPPYIEGQPGLWHSPFGVLVFWGRGVVPGALPTASLFDIAPTVLDLLGLPPAQDMPGKSLRQAVGEDPEAGSPHPPIASYEAYGDPRHPPDTAESSPSGAAASEALVETLRSLGYVGPAPQPAPGGTGGNSPRSDTTALYHSNLAAVLMAKGDLVRAEEEYRRSLEINQDTLTALQGLADLEERKGHPDQAIVLLQRAIGRGLRYQPIIFLKLARLYAQAGREPDGLQYLQQFLPALQDEPLLHTGIGVLYSRRNEVPQAEASLRAALALEPLALPAMEELFILEDREGRATELIPELEAATRQEEGSFMHRNWLGLALSRRGDLVGAEREWKRAMELAPDQVGPAANLGGLYLKGGRYEEARVLLERAGARDPRSVEVRTNLIVALGRQEKLEEARIQFEEGVRISGPKPQFYNAMAFAYHLNRKPEEAIPLLETSLRKDPAQEDAAELLREVRQAAGRGGGE